MPSTPLFPLPEGLELTSVSDTKEEVLVRVTSHWQTSVCPLCSTHSFAIHSYYRRRPLDLPCASRPIRLLLSVKKFFCRAAECKRKIFTERLPDLIEVSSHLTKRLRTAVQEIGFATCGKGGERLSSKLGIKLSDTTLLWSLFLVPLQVSPTVEVIGIDDWAWRNWLQSHEEVEVVSRDRGGTYVDGATQGAPFAIQVCDRWHLMKNLGDAVEACLIRKRVRIPDDQLKSAEGAEPSAPVETRSLTVENSPSNASEHARRSANKQKTSMKKAGVFKRLPSICIGSGPPSVNTSTLRGSGNGPHGHQEPACSIPIGRPFSLSGSKDVATGNIFYAPSERKDMKALIRCCEHMSRGYANNFR